MSNNEAYITTVNRILEIGCEIKELTEESKKLRKHLASLIPQSPLTKDSPGKFVMDHPTKPDMVLSVKVYPAADGKDWNVITEEFERV